MTNAIGKRRDGREHILLGVLLFTGLAAIVGGALLAIKPDGSLLQADVSALKGTPFPDWRVPGILLALLVGAGGVGAGAWVINRGWRSRELVLLYAIGLLAFETVEFFTIGFQPLEAVFAAVALLLLRLAGTSRTIGDQEQSQRQLDRRLTPQEVKP